MNSTWLNNLFIHTHTHIKKTKTKQNRAKKKKQEARVYGSARLGHCARKSTDVWAWFYYFIFYSK
jgi:hypothetical protein